MKKQKTLLIAAGALVLVLAMLGIYIVKKPKPAASTGSKQVEVTVRDDKGEEKGYQVNTDAEYLIQVLDELKQGGEFTYEGTDGDYGMYITSVNGLEANYDVNQAFWSIYVNGEYGSYGVSDQPVNDGDQFMLAYES